MNLKLLLPLKKVLVNDKEVSIPKLGLRHHTILKDIKDPIMGLHKIVSSIRNDLTAAETDLVMLHLLEFNGRIKSSVIKDGFEYKLDNAYICQRLNFSYAGKEYKFRSHTPFEEFGPVDAVLSSLYLGDDVPDFLDMPAFVAKWAEDITSTVAIKGPSGLIKGTLAITELLK